MSALSNIILSFINVASGAARYEDSFRGALNRKQSEYARIKELSYMQRIGNDDNDITVAELLKVVDGTLQDKPAYILKKVSLSDLRNLRDCLAAIKDQAQKVVKFSNKGFGSLTSPEYL